MTRLRVAQMVVGVTVGVLASAVVSSAQTAADQQNIEEQRQIESGSGLFKTYCVVCHGKDAKGTGPLASSMRRKPADLTSLSARNGGTFPAEMTQRVIDGKNPVKGHGGGDMPVWGDALSRSQDGGSPEVVQHRIEELVNYLKSIQRTP